MTYVTIGLYMSCTSRQCFVPVPIQRLHLKKNPYRMFVKPQFHVYKTIHVYTIYKKIMFNYSRPMAINLVFSAKCRQIHPIKRRVMNFGAPYI